MPLAAWRVSVENIVVNVFGKGSPQHKHLASHLHQYIDRSDQVLNTAGVLAGALADLEGGFLIGQEFLIAGDIFDSVLEQAKYLSDHGFKDPAAILARVVIEDALRRIARQEGLDATGTAAALNEALRKCGRYAKPQWRIIQSWLDIGNSAAHGSFDEYSKDDVSRLITEVERFVAQEFLP